MTPQEMCELIQTQAEYNNHSLEGLERGLIPFATLPQVGFVAGLLRKCGVPEPWRLYITGQLEIINSIRRSNDFLGKFSTEEITKFLVEK